MTNDHTPLPPGLATYPFLDALRERRSRRFARGMRMASGPLAFQSQALPRPLTEQEEALLAFAACGITGPALADLTFDAESGGNIMAGLVGRAVSSGDGIQTVALVVSNDQATYLLKRPADFNPREIQELLDLANRDEFIEVYRRSRVRIKEGRAAPSKDPIFNINVNRWSVYQPGTTWFLPVNDVTLMYINGLLEVLNEKTGLFVLDERAGFQPAGLKPFARSRGGHLHDNAADGRVATVRQVETMVTEFVTVEQGMMLQNLGLMSQAIGLGGFPSFANHEFSWFQALGFRMGKLPASRYLGAGPLVSFGLKLLKQDVEVPYALGLEVDGQPVLKAFCPPYYASMREAVHAVVQYKFGPQGVFRNVDGLCAWKEHARVIQQIPSISEAAINATTAYCEYLLKRYGRFPVYLAPYRTVLGFQAAHLDVAFYEKYYRPDALSQRQRDLEGSAEGQHR